MKQDNPSCYSEKYILKMRSSLQEILRKTGYFYYIKYLLPLI